MTVEKIAAIMTQQQVEALLMDKPDDALIFCPTVCRSLAINGLVTAQLTPLGLAVREYLKWQFMMTEEILKEK